MREDKIYDNEYLYNYNFLIQDYRNVFDNMLDSGISVPEKIIKLEHKSLIKQFKRDVKKARKRTKRKIKLEIKFEKRQKRQIRIEKIKSKMKSFFSRFKKKNKKNIVPESSLENEK